jgi:hypothetical protein
MVLLISFVPVYLEPFLFLPKARSKIGYKISANVSVSSIVLHLESPQNRQAVRTPFGVPLLSQAPHCIIDCPVDVEATSDEQHLAR